MILYIKYSDTYTAITLVGYNNNNNHLFIQANLFSKKNAVINQGPVINIEVKLYILFNY
jgi:uncharacterized membrane protein YdbT with pleckstrin-like domain